jgi:hypothetical protein
VHSILFERLDTKHSAFDRLLELAKRDNVTTVVISRPEDLGAGQRHRLADEAGAHVVVAGSSP